jgi:Zn-dependent protease with chaperone function
MIARESQLLRSLQTYVPRMETYIQDVRPDPELGSAPVNDHYFLGRLKLQPDGTITVQSLLPKSLSLAFVKNAAGHVAPPPHIIQYEPRAFYYSIVMDTTRFDRQHYNFEFVRREFLGEVRCLVFDVKPKRIDRRRGIGLFEGRVWAEDQDYNIVRFNGTFTPAPRGSVYFHFDSWRENTQPGLWLPTYAYSEEAAFRFTAQVRLWGYGLQSPTHQSEMTEVVVDAPTEVQDSSESSRDVSVVAKARAWQQQAEDNVLERLQKAGLLAPRGEVDKVLETVVNNLVVTNHLDALPPIHCRVLLTSPLESLAIGNTIILSRGLIDVLPDEPSLAVMLGHELGHIVLQQTINIKNTQWAFEDRLMISDVNLMRYLNFNSSEHDEEVADATALQLMKNSPYKDQLGDAGLFLRAMADMAPHAPQLFGAHLGSRLVQGNHVRRMAELMTSAPPLLKKRVDQIAALPLGGRVKVNPWSDDIQLIKAKPVALLSAREKMPFAVTPTFPYLTRLHSPVTSTSTR